MSGLLEILDDPQRLHAAMVHLPIAAAWIGLLFTVALAVRRAKSATLRWTCLTIYLLGAAAALVAANVGEEAKYRLSEAGAVLSQHMREHLDTHESLGEPAWIVLLITAAFVALTALTHKRLRHILIIASVLVAIACASWLTIVGKVGGELVYLHGLGTPTSPANLNQPADATDLHHHDQHVPEANADTEAAEPHQH